MTRTALAGLASAALGMTGALWATASQADTVIRNVTVVDTADGTLSPGSALVIRDGAIAAVIADADAVAAAGDTVIDGAGAYVVPGFNDMHAHGMVTPATAAPDTSGHQHPEPDNQQVYSTLFLVNGVTGFRQMSGSAAFIDSAHAMNAASNAGTLNAPEIVQVTGDIMAGQVASPADAAAFVDSVIAEGGDFLKLVGGRPDVMMALVNEAAARHFPVAGHLQPMLDTATLSRIGWHSVEHLGATPGMLMDCAAAAPQIRARMAEAGPPPRFPPTFLLSPMLYQGPMLAPALGAILASYQPDRCAALAQVFIDNDTWQVPTLIRLHTMSDAGDETFRNDPRLRYLAPANRALWQQLGAEFAQTITPEMQAVFDQFFALQVRTTTMMNDAGVPMMAGSDIGGMWILPGFGLHDEFGELARAGFTPLQILQSTTLNPARYLGREDTMGRIAAGVRADLVLLAANPLDDAANLNAITGVMRAGQYHDRAALDAMLAEIETMYAE